MSSTSTLTERFVQSVGRHFVTLSCIQTAQDQTQQYTHVFSGFMVEIAEEWFYVTAGHILRDVRKAVNAGSTFDIWRLGGSNGWEFLR